MIFDVEELAELARAYMLATDTNRNALSEQIAGRSNNRLIEKILKGHDCRTTVAARATEFFERNWPADTPWPQHIQRRQ